MRKVNIIIYSLFVIAGMFLILIFSGFFDSPALADSSTPEKPLYDATGTWDISSVKVTTDYHNKNPNIKNSCTGIRDAVEKIFQDAKTIIMMQKDNMFYAKVGTYGYKGPIDGNLYKYSISNSFMAGRVLVLVSEIGTFTLDGPEHLSVISTLSIYIQYSGKVCDINISYKASRREDSKNENGGDVFIPETNNKRVY